jgi:hypothetical protein
MGCERGTYADEHNVLECHLGICSRCDGVAKNWRNVLMVFDIQLAFISCRIWEVYIFTHP